jgi:hypothetical protein
MGLFSRKKTTVNTSVQEATATRIVKLTYVQSIMVNGGVARTEQFSDVSDPIQYRLGGNSSTSRNFVTKAFDTLNNPYGILGAGGAWVAAGISSALFGKKTTRSTTVDVKESGWTVVKSWAQPEFDLIRYAIGIKEVTAASYSYAVTSEFISKPWSSPKEIIKLRVFVDQFIPPQFPPGSYIDYYVRPDIQGSDWIRINPMELPTQFNEDGSVVARIISFNTEKPIGARSEEMYITTKEPVKAVRFRGVMRRPIDSLDAYTPIVKSYRLLLTPKNGL